MMTPREDMWDELKNGFEHVKRFIYDAAAEEISIDTAAAAVSSGLDGIFVLKMKQRTALKTFSCWKRCFCSSPLWFWQEF